MIMRIMLCFVILVWMTAAGICSAQTATREYIRDLQSSVPAVRKQAAMALGRSVEKSAVPALIQALKDPQPEVRREAAHALGLIKDPQAAPALIKALRDSDKNVRAFAAYALGEIREPKSSGPLIQALCDPEWTVRDEAAWALREIHDPGLAAPLVALLRDERADVSQVVWVLRHLEGADAIELLAALLREPDAKIRARAVRAMGELQSAAGVDALLTALKDPDPGVRRAAVEGLRRSKDERVAKAMEELFAREKDGSVCQLVEPLLRKASAPQELAAWWSFDDRNPKVAKDVTGRGSDGEIKGCTPAEGKVGAGLQFSKGKYISLGKPLKLSHANKPFTVMAWVKSESKNGVVVARGGAATGYSLYLKDGLPKFGIARAQGAQFIAAGSQPAVGSWVHLAGVIKPTQIELYVNGKLAAATKTPGLIPGVGGQGMEIGFDAGNSAAEITDNFEGLIDEVKMSLAALPESEIARQAGLNQ